MRQEPTDGEGAGSAAVLFGLVAAVCHAAHQTALTVLFVLPAAVAAVAFVAAHLSGREERQRRVRMEAQIAMCLVLAECRKQREDGHAG